ncbi:MAG: small ribosomal subunit Rsm22 family protein [Treponema sp.]
MPKFYEKFVKTQKPSSSSGTAKSRADNSKSESRTKNAKRGRKIKDAAQTAKDCISSLERNGKPDARFISHSPMFDGNKVPQESRALLEDFDKIIQEARPLNSRQLLNLPKDIRVLSHELTDERDERRLGYMNNREQLSAYARYFLWWNLVRLTRVFANIGHKEFALPDGAVCLDIGSGPLTLPIALWLSLPELRNSRLTWYCMDISQGALTLGEDLYLSVAAKLRPSNPDSPPHWNIIRVKGVLGTPLKEKADFIFSANTFNEVLQGSRQNAEEEAQQQVQNLLSYAKRDAAFFFAEPGTPTAANFISLLRKNFIARNYLAVLPCPHQTACPMQGTHAHRGGREKWCNFAFGTDDASRRLLKLSDAAGIPKERAVLSWLFLKKNTAPETAVKTPPAADNAHHLELRITSDEIKLPAGRAGFYACSEHGLVLAIDNAHKGFTNGGKLCVDLLTKPENLERDKKSGALKITVD